MTLFYGVCDHLLVFTEKTDFLRSTEREVTRKLQKSKKASH